MGNTSSMKMEATDDNSTSESGEDATKALANDSTEEMPAILTSKAALSFGLTSGYFLKGLSVGLFFAGKEYNTMAILTGVVGTTMLGNTSYMFWTKEKEIKEDF